MRDGAESRGKAMDGSDGKVLCDRHPAACAGRMVQEERAQATFEYALVVCALMAVASGLALLWHAGADGTLARLVEAAASHALGGTGPLDIALY